MTADWPWSDDHTLLAYGARWHAHLRNAMPADKADESAAVWLAMRVAEIAVAMPTGNMQYAPKPVQRRYYAAYDDAIAECREVVAALVASDMAGATTVLRGVLGRATDSTVSRAA